MMRLNYSRSHCVEGEREKRKEVGVGVRAFEYLIDVYLLYLVQYRSTEMCFVFSVC